MPLLRSFACVANSPNNARGASLRNVLASERLRRPPLSILSASAAMDSDRLNMTERFYSQTEKAALAAACFLNGQHSADLARLGVFADILGAVDRGDPVGIPLHHPLEHIDLLQRRHQRVRARGGVGQIHKGGKALEHVVALLQLFQIDVAVVAGKGLPSVEPLGILRLIFLRHSFSLSSI